MEWLLIAATASVFALLRHHGIPEWQIWLLFWAANLLLSGGVVLFHNRSGIDLTLMQSLRSLIDLAAARSKWPGLALETVSFIRLLVWDGPCQLLIFFQLRLTSTGARIGFLVASSAIQMLIWTALYARSDVSINSPCMPGRVTGLNDYLHRIFAEIRFLRRLGNWYGSGEPFDYLNTATTLKPAAITAMT